MSVIVLIESELIIRHLLIENTRCCELEAASDLLRWIGAMDLLVVYTSVSASNAL
jgi:hypothetical protein